MKNFALLLSSLAMASSAFAVAPEVNKNLPQLSSASVEPVKMTASSMDGDKVLTGTGLAKVGKEGFRRVQRKASGLSVSYTEPAGLFALGLTEDFYGIRNYSYRKGPAYTPLKWTNTSVGATEFEWSVLVGPNESALFNTVDLVHSEDYSTVDAPVLTGMDAEGNTAVYQIGAEAISDTDVSASSVGYFYGGSCELEEGYDYGLSTYMYGNTPGSGFTTFQCMEYNTTDKTTFDPATGLFPVFTDETEGLGLKDVQFVGYANYFDAPAAPYFITKMWSWMSIQANKATTVEMTLYKVTEDGGISDEVIAAGEANVAATSTPESTMVSFDLFALDEDGLQINEPIVIDCDFIAVMTFNKEDIDIVNAVSASGAQYPTTAENPYPSNARLVIDSEGRRLFVPSLYSYYLDQNTFMAVTDFMWMVDAVFPWAYVVGDKNIVEAPVEGGEVSFPINSYFNVQYFDFSLSEGSESWVDFENATLTTDPVTYAQIVTIPVAALPEGVEGRSANIEGTLYGVSVELTINQGKVSEGNAVSSIVIDRNAEYYDLQGRKVANPDKGIYIKKTGNKSEKVIL